MSRLMACLLTCTCQPNLLFIVLISMILVSGNVFLLSEAHFVVEKIQQWQSKQDNVLIQFTYEPEKPIIDTFTELKFNIQNASTGEHIQNLTGRVVVTNGQRLFKFENISIPNGHFSVKYIFPDDGTHQVLLRLVTNNDLIPASFKVFVPHQSPPSILDPFPSSPATSNDDLGLWISKILAILLPAAAITTLVIMLKKKPKKHR
jgi:hypothetical protein